MPSNYLALFTKTKTKIIVLNLLRTYFIGIFGFRYLNILSSCNGENISSSKKKKENLRKFDFLLKLWRMGISIKDDIMPQIKLDPWKSAWSHIVKTFPVKQWWSNSYRNLIFKVNFQSQCQFPTGWVFLVVSFVGFSPFSTDFFFLSFYPYHLGQLFLTLFAH